MSDAKLKKEPKKAWYRIALKRCGVSGIYTMTADTEAEEKLEETEYNFVGWLTDRIEYELPEDKP